jgi:4'-phosphopantetheinyl transferase EntD
LTQESPGEVAEATAGPRLPEHPGQARLGPVFEGLLPATVRWVTATPAMASAPLLGDEAEAVRRAVPRRVAEFRSGRAAARAVLATFGVGRATIPVARDRAPVWPGGFVGSITHCDGLCVAAVARQRDVLALGIDAEPAEPLPAGLLQVVASPGERSRLTDPLSGRVLFSAKEAFYKCWSATGRPFLGFRDVELIVGDGRFRACSVDGRDWTGRWAVRGGFVLTASWVDASVLSLPAAPTSASQEDVPIR